MRIEILELVSEYRDWQKSMLVENWGSERLVSRGQLLEPLNLPGLIVLADDKPVGCLSYRLTGKQCELVALNSLLKSAGVGTLLLEYLNEYIKNKGCNRIWLITTNDNIAAMRFYQKCGYSFVAIHQNALIQSRKLKPEIPLIGVDGISIKDEIEMEILLK